MKTLRSALLLLAILPVNRAAGATPPVRNDRVVVWDETIHPGESVKWSGDHPLEIVYFTNGILTTSEGSGHPEQSQVKPGQSVYLPAKARTVKNLAPSDLHLARIEFLGKGRMETWGRTGLASNYSLLFENQYTRVYEIRIPAGTKEPQHTHHDRVVVCLSGAELRHTMPDGHEEPSTLKTGEIVWRAGSTHVGQNLGKTNLWVIAVEPK